MRGTADFAMTQQDNHDGSTKIATAPFATNSFAPGLRVEAVGSRSLDNVAVWVNESGAAGEVIR
jgi:hypothetical protein